MKGPRSADLGTEARIGASGNSAVSLIRGGIVDPQTVVPIV